MTENPGALNYTLIIKVHPPEITPKSQFWIALNCFAVTFTNFNELCTLLALERDSYATGVCNGSRKDLDKAQEKRKIAAAFLYLS